ncbi:hypothetical protein [Hyphobacterium sp.]|uniref:hypothetical protein n=1 Tax=Hyphobacterium sp. TaxID=2004662 RepID=UPI003B5205E0
MSEETTQSETPADDQIHPVARPFTWIEKPIVHFWFLVILAVLSFGLGLFDLVYARHEYLHFAELPGFYAWFGFGSFSLAVLAGWPLRRLLGREENYYEKAAGDD